MIEQYQNKHIGQRCFVVGNGPSLNQTDLDQIQVPSFAMNRISLLYPKVTWRPSYYVCPTGNSKRENWKKDILKSVELGIPCWFWDTKFNHDIYGSYENVEFLNCTQHAESAQVYERPPLDWFSLNPLDRVSKYGTSLLVAMQLAFYMGFKEIVLVGCDLGFATKNHHFSNQYDLGGHAPLSKLDGTMLAAHRLCKAAGEAYGVNILNATIGGQLDVYNRIDFNEAIRTN